MSYNCLISCRYFLFAYNLHDIARILNQILKTKKKKTTVEILIHCLNFFYDDKITYEQSDEMNVCNQIK